MFRELLLKEVKDLVRDPRIWLPFIISALVLPAIGFIVSTGVSESIKEVTSPIKLLVSDLDRGNITEYVLSNLSKYEVINKLKIVNVRDFKLLKELAVREGFDTILIIWDGFSEGLISSSRANVTVIEVIKSISMTSTLKSTTVLSLLNDAIADVLLRSYGVNLSISFVKSPTNPSFMSYVVPRDELLLGYQQVLTQLGLTSFILPLVMMIVTITVLQMAATSTAVENEEKTLEVLLTLPISRFKILLSKLLGSFIVALVGSTFNIVGFILYLYIFSITITVSVIEGGLGLTPSLYLLEPTSATYLAISLILASLAMAALGTTIGVLSNDVRIATTISGPIVMLVILPSYYLMFTDTMKLEVPLRYLLYALPFTQPMLIAKEAIAAKPDPLTPLWLLTSLLFSLTLILLTSRLLTLDKLLKLQRVLSSLKMKRRSS